MKSARNGACSEGFWETEAVRHWFLLLGCLGLAWASGMEDAWSANLGNFAGGGHKTAAAMPAEAGFVPGEAWLEPWIAKRSLDELFIAMATGIRFEPYQGVLRGAQGTAMARRGNSLDQALLLRQVLDAQGYQTRLVEGELDEGNALVLLRGLYPPAIPRYQYSSEYAPFSLEGSSLVSSVRRHYWVELRQSDGSWLPLDPSFPRAKVGEAYAKASHHYEGPRPEWDHRLAIRLLIKTADNRVKTLFQKEKPVREWGYMPISLSCIAVPLEEPRKQKRKGSVTGLFGGALGGGSTQRQEGKATPPKRLGTRYRWTWQVPGDGARSAVHDVLTGDSETRIAREWLEITLSLIHI